MEKLKQHPNLSIAEVANMFGLKTEDLRDEQLNCIRCHVKRDSILW